MAAASLPRVFRKLVVTKISSNFREAVELKTVAFPASIKPDHIVVKNKFCGINASDVNQANGLGGYVPDPTPPFDIGFESIGEVVAVGDHVKKFSLGQAVAVVNAAAFTEYHIIPAKMAIPLPALQPEFLAFPVSGLTADLALHECADLNPKKTVLVTAAAGGTGQFAVQLAKLAGCHVIGTCSTDHKVEFLKKIGCDRPINYKKENLARILKSEYKDGIDVIYESIGGEVFDTCLKALARFGKLIVIGAISTYENSFASLQMSPVLQSLPVALLLKSASVHGFFLMHYGDKYKESMTRLTQLYISGKLHIEIDNGQNSSVGKFQGLESIFDAVSYMYSGQNKGKIVVELPFDASSRL